AGRAAPPQLFAALLPHFCRYHTELTAVVRPAARAPQNQVRKLQAVIARAQRAVLVAPVALARQRGAAAAPETGRNHEPAPFDERVPRTLERTRGLAQGGLEEADLPALAQPLRAQSLHQRGLTAGQLVETVAEQHHAAATERGRWRVAPREAPAPAPDPRRHRVERPHRPITGHHLGGRIELARRLRHRARARTQVE